MSAASAEARLRARIRRAQVELPGESWSADELRALVDLLDSVVANRRRVDPVGNVSWLADRR